MATKKEAAKQAEIQIILRERRGSDIVDLAPHMSPKVLDAIMLGRHEVMISGAHPQQVKRLIACLNDLNFAAEEAMIVHDGMSGMAGKV